KKIRRDYRDAAGNKLPGVTTILGDNLGWSKNGLIGWAHKLGREGRSLNERDKAADKGTATHALAWRLLGYDDGTPVSAEDEREHMPNALRVVERIKAEGWEIIACEEALTVDFGGGLGCGGTIDLVVRCAKRGGCGIVDLKSGKGIFPEVAIQLGAYRTMWNQQANLQHQADWAAVIHAHPGEALDVVDIPRESLDAGSFVFSHLLAIQSVRSKVRVR
ncbi:MAG: PD-(D/E)XK nuclease family protein, partial [Alphaproteobacteria bacterium]